MRRVLSCVDENASLTHRHMNNFGLRLVWLDVRRKVVRLLAVVVGVDRLRALYLVSLIVEVGVGA